MAEDTILAVDIGADSLKVAEFSYPADGGMVLNNFAIAEYNLEDADANVSADTLAETFATLLTENYFSAKNVHLSISGQSAFVRFVKLPPIGDDEARMRQIVEYEARQNVPFPMDEVVWDYQLIGGEDDQTEVEVMFVVVKSDLIEGMAGVIETMGLVTAEVEVAPTCCYNSSRANDIGDDECAMVLNIGGRCSNLVFIDKGRFFVRNIPIAGHSITQQIAKEFGISYADAEEMKRRHGFVALGGAYEEPDSEVSATVSKIVRNIMTRLHGEINRSINVYRSQQKGRRPTKLFLAGGSSVMAFTPRFFSEKLRVPVEYFNPFHVVSLGEDIDREELAEVAHMFSEVIGLALRHAATCPIEISLLPDSIRKQNAIKQKTPYFYASAVSLIFCLAVIYLGFSKQLMFDNARYGNTEKLVGKTEQMRKNVDAAKRELDSLKKEYDVAADMLDKRGQWYDLLNEVENILPDNVWLVDLKPSEAPTASVKKAGNETVLSVFGVSRVGRQKKEDKKAAAAVLQSVEWIRMKGHSLCGKGSFGGEELLKENIKKSSMFASGGKEPTIKSELFEPAVGENNITTFELLVKLGKPIKI